jgi:hypothetical protein
MFFEILQYGGVNVLTPLMRSHTMKRLGMLFGLVMTCLMASGAFAAKVSQKQVNGYAQAYIFGFPLVLMHQSEKIMLKKSNKQYGKPMLNHFDHLKQFPNADFTDVVSPNVDTLYSIAWISLKQGPLLLRVPNMEKHYYLLPMLDAWTNVFASPGTRTTGSKAGQFLLVGPGQKVKKPKNTTLIQAPTNMVWIIGRTEANADNIKTVNQLQDQMVLTPYPGKKQQADTVKLGDVNTQQSPIEQVVNMPPAVFFNQMAMLMKNNPPAKADRRMVNRLKRLGITAGQPFDGQRLGKQAQATLAAAKDKALQRIKATIPRMGKKVNGWQYNVDLGTYKTRYLKRAAVAYMGLGANLPEDAVYPLAYTDYRGEALDGKNRYVIHFDKSSLPPVKAFWSLTLYNDKQFFVPNALNRYALGSNNALNYGKDGSLTLYVQHDEPDAKNKANWLPAPSGSFNLIMRLYWPETSVIKGKWKLPKIKQVKS